MPIKIPLSLHTHQRKIAILYKKWLRHLETNTENREAYRFRYALARAEFDEILNQKDMRISKQMLIDKEKELNNFIREPVYFPTAPEGVAFNRYPPVKDWLLDRWHPLEKAVYPEYFARRELRKQQFVEMWEKQYGPPPPDDH